MAGKARNVDRSRSVTLVCECDDGTSIEQVMSSDGTLLGTLLNADALDRKIIERCVGGKRVVRLSLMDEAPAPSKKK